MELIFILLALACMLVGMLVIGVACVALLARILESIFERD